ncbi:MAG: hypothetical protein COA78_06140 [Blastopirellula sp.]|nr:MAG: hypothetical protein COA78_06140 [Blastopirellula sp.]
MPDQITNTEIEPQKTFDLFVMVESAWRYWWGCIVLGGICSVIGIFICNFIPIKFRATALLKLESPNGLIEQFHESSAAQREFRHTQKTILQMNHILSRVLDTQEVSLIRNRGIKIGDPDELESLLEVKLPRSSQIMEVSFQHDDAETAAVLTNTLVKIYLEEISAVGSAQQSKQIKTLEKLHQDAEVRLGVAWNRLQVLAREIGSGNPATLSLQTQAEIENYRAYSRQLRVVRSELRDSLRIVRAIRESPEILAEEMPEDASMHSVKFAMFSARLSKEEAILKWGPEHPDVIAALHKERLLREYYQKSASKEITENQSTEERLLTEPLASIKRLGEEETTLISILKEINNRLSVISGDKAAELEILRNNIDRLENQSDQIWQAKEKIRIQQFADSRVQLVKYADIPKSLDTNKRNKIMLILGVGGFVFGCVCVSMGEILTGRIHSKRDAIARTAIIPIANANPLSKAIRINSVQDTEKQQLDIIDQVFAQYLHSKKNENHHIVIVTSAKEEKEIGFVAEQIAASFARTGNKTLLLDLDLGQTLKKCHEKAIGVSDYLQGNTELSSIINADSSIDNLFQVKSGKLTKAPIPLILSSRMESMISSFREDFDFIVLKTPPILQLPDSIHLAKWADIVILSIQINQSTCGSIRSAANSLKDISMDIRTLLVR